MSFIELEWWFFIGCMEYKSLINKILFRNQTNRHANSQKTEKRCYKIKKHLKLNWNQSEAKGWFSRETSHNSVNGTSNLTKYWKLRGLQSLIKTQKTTLKCKMKKNSNRKRNRSMRNWSKRRIMSHKLPSATRLIKHVGTPAKVL